MREIKFRGKRIDNNEWIYGNIHFPNKIFRGVLICPNTTYGDIAPGMEDNDDFEEFKKHGAVIGHYHKVNFLSVGQFTGLHDKNGKEIYEGDVLEIIDMVDVSTDPFEEPVSVKQCIIGEIIYNESLAGFDIFVIERDLHLKGYCLMDDLQDNYEIIGNIYENPELLKK